MIFRQVKESFYTEEIIFGNTQIIFTFTQQKIGDL